MWKVNTVSPTKWEHQSYEKDLGIGLSGGNIVQNWNLVFRLLQFNDKISLLNNSIVPDTYAASDWWIALCNIPFYFKGKHSEFEKFKSINLSFLNWIGGRGHRPSEVPGSHWNSPWKLIKYTKHYSLKFKLNLIIPHLDKIRYTVLNKQEQF